MAGILGDDKPQGSIQGCPHCGNAIKLAGDVVSIPNIEEINKSNRYQNAGGFRPGVPSAPVLPISPTSQRNNPAFR